MCSTIVQVIFNLALILGIGLTVFALVSPGWIKIKVEEKEGLFEAGVQLIKNGTIDRGFFTCTASTEDIKDGESVKKCAEETWKTMKDWEKATFSLLVVAIAAGLVALIWSMVLCCCLCCCKSCFSFPLPILASIAFCLDAAAVTVYYFKSGQDPPKLELSTFDSVEKIEALGKSVWIAAGGAAAYLIASILGCILSKVAKVSPV